jgi:hypothetical protein
MGTITDPEQATTVAASICDALTTLAAAEFGKFDEPALLEIAPILEHITRLPATWVDPQQRPRRNTLHHLADILHV